MEVYKDLAIKIEKQVNDLLNEISQYKKENGIDGLIKLIYNFYDLEDAYYTVTQRNLNIDIDDYIDVDISQTFDDKTDYYHNCYINNFNKNKTLYLFLSKAILDFYNEANFFDIKQDYTDIISKEECNEIVNAFYSSLGFDSEAILKEMNNNSIIQYLDDDNLSSNINGRSYPTLPLKGSYIFCYNNFNIGRILTTVHEIAHVIAYHKYLPSMDQFMMFVNSKYHEFLPYMIERLLINYLLNNKLHVKDCYSELNSRHLQIYKDARKVMLTTFIPDIKTNSEFDCLIDKKELKPLLVSQGFDLKEIDKFCRKGINIYDPINNIYGEIIGSKLLLDYQTNPKAMLAKLDEFMRLAVTRSNDQIISSLGFDNKALLEFKDLKREIINNKQKCLQLFK